MDAVNIRASIPISKKSETPAGQGEGFQISQSIGCALQLNDITIYMQWVAFEVFRYLGHYRSAGVLL